jgi:hypothetical protein
MTDLSSLSTTDKSKAGARMDLLDPSTGDVLTHKGKGDKSPKKMFLVLLGPESNVTRRAIATITNRDKRRKKGVTQSDDEIQRDAESDCRLLASMTVGGEVFYNDKWMQVSSENVYDLYMDVLPVRSQALVYALDIANFTKG